MYKALIIEDEINSANVLKEMVTSIFNDIHVIGIANNRDEAIKMVHKCKPNIVFLDINLGAQSGFEVLKATNTEAFEVIVITAHSEYAIEAIKNSAVDYILKPFDFEELKEAINKAKEKLEVKQENTQALEKNADKITITNTDGIKFININDIIYIKADSCYSEFYLQNNEKEVSTKSLAYYEKLLCNHFFMRTHKSYIVNLKYVKGYSKGRSGVLYLSNGEELPISESKKQELIKISLG